MDTEILRFLPIIPFILGIILGLCSGDAKVAAGTILFFQVIVFFVEMAVRMNGDGGSSSTYKYFPERKQNGNTGAKHTIQTPNINVQKSPKVPFDGEDVMNVAAIPDGIDLDPKEKLILKIIMDRYMTSQEILSKVPRSANIYEYKDALTHLEEIGTIERSDDGRFSIVLSYDYIKRKAANDQSKKDIETRKREEQEKREAELLKNAIYYKEEELTSQEKHIINILSKRSLRAQDILKVIPREEDITPYKDAISHLRTVGAITAKPDGTLVHNKTFFVVNGSETGVPLPAETPAPEVVAVKEEVPVPATEKVETPAPAIKPSVKPGTGVSEADVERLAQHAGNIVAMFKDTFSTGFGLDIEKALMFASGMAGYACHQAVKANKEPYTEVTTADKKKYYMGDSVNRYLLEGKYSVLVFCDGFYEHSGLGMMKPDPMEIVKKEAKAIGDKGYKIWDKIEPAYAYNEIKACWEGIYQNMTSVYCKSPSEWPVLFAIVLQNIMIEAGKITSISMIYNKALECAIYISKMDDDSI